MKLREVDTSGQQNQIAKSRSASLPRLALLDHLCSKHKPVMHAACSEDLQSTA